MSEQAFQDQMGENHCFGCGPDNPDGLQIKSFWEAPGEAVCTFFPRSHHSAKPTNVLYGGLVAALIDCHSVCTATAYADTSAGREIGAGEAFQYVTGSLEVRYLNPAPIAGPIVVRARIEGVDGKKTVVRSTLSAGGEACAEGRVVAIRVPGDWGHARS